MAHYSGAKNDPPLQRCSTPISLQQEHPTEHSLDDAKAYINFKQEIINTELTPRIRGTLKPNNILGGHLIMPTKTPILPRYRPIIGNSHEHEHTHRLQSPRQLYKPQF